jgi:hypothetical protein
MNPPMNLSCGRCQRIQPFSGSPLSCTVCGWVLGQSFDGGEPTPKFTPREDPIKKFISGKMRPAFEKFLKIVVFGGLALCGLIVAIDWLRPEREKLAEEYSIPVSKVIIDEKPHGYDFDDAPLGNKHCHFEKEITPMRECATCPVTSVYVNWRKVAE